MRAAILNIILGLWVMVAPGLLDLGKTAANSNYIAGPLIISFAITALWEVNRSVRYLNILVGLWLVAAPFVLSFDKTAFWTSLVSGVLITALSLVKGTVKGRYGGGWQSLFVKEPLHMKEVDVQVK